MGGGGQYERLIGSVKLNKAVGKNIKFHVRRATGPNSWCGVPGHFAEKHFAERHFAETHFGERTLCPQTISRKDFLPNGHFDERTLRRKDIRDLKIYDAAARRRGVNI